jgi:hypothetical protein
MARKPNKPRGQPRPAVRIGAGVLADDTSATSGSNSEQREDGQQTSSASRVDSSLNAPPVPRDLVGNATGVNWGKVGALAAIAAVVAPIILFVGQAGLSHFSEFTEFKTYVRGMQEDIKEIRAKVESLLLSSARTSVRIDGIESANAKSEKSLQPKPEKK